MSFSSLSRSGGEDRWPVSYTHLDVYKRQESHFSLAIEWAGCAGQNRVARQRAVNKALGDLPGQRVHALPIKATAPGE